MGCQMNDIIILRGTRSAGSASKEFVHQNGIRHRAFSVLLLDDDENIILQQRSKNKYHSAGLWSNACCGHPRPGERTSVAARRRLGEELGVGVRSLQLCFRTDYRVHFSNGLIENEHVYVFVGRQEGAIDFDPSEVEAVRSVEPALFFCDVRRRPEKYTYWLRCYVAGHQSELELALASPSR
ncbi:isopentenyl-diphosphate Delta-isomerase [Rhizobium leguminosarum bv. viciae]|nr:isopentenyl-diphosphate Delta-isomerase [Rhizobium leguminosarum bv. viciae]